MITFYTEDEVAKHNSKESCWCIANNNVYNLTQFVNIHPGGKIILNYAGQDITSVFYSVHPMSVIDKMDILNKYDKYKIGELVRYNRRDNINLTNYKIFKNRINNYFIQKNKNFSFLNFRGALITNITLFLLNLTVITLYIKYIKKPTIFLTFLLGNVIVLTLLYQWHPSNHGALLNNKTYNTTLEIQI